jgi:hypothetical protein
MTNKQATRRLKAFERARAIAKARNDDGDDE